MRAVLINSGLTEGRTHAYHQGQLGLLEGLHENGVDVIGWGSCRQEAGSLEVELIITSIYNGDLDYALSGAIKARHVIPIVAAIDSGDVLTCSDPLIPFVVGYAKSENTTAYYDGLGLPYHILPFGAPDIPFRANPPESPFAWVFAGGKSHRGQMWDDYVAPLIVESHKRHIPFLVANENDVCVSDASLVPALDSIINTSLVRPYYPGWESESWEIQYQRADKALGTDEDLAQNTVIRWPALMHGLYPSVRVCPNVHCPEQKQGDIRQDANQRLFDIPAASGLQVCDWTELFAEYFDQKEIVWTENAAWWVDSVVDWSGMTNTKYRRRAGWERVQREHLWRHRAAQLLGWLKEATG